MCSLSGILRCYRIPTTSISLRGGWREIDISMLASVSHTTAQTSRTVGSAISPTIAGVKDFLVLKFMESIE